MQTSQLTPSSSTSLHRVLRAFSSAGMTFDRRVRDAFGYNGDGRIKGLLFVGIDSTGSVDIIIDVVCIGTVGEVHISETGEITEILGADCYDLEKLVLEIASRNVNVGTILYPL